MNATIHRMEDSLPSLDGERKVVSVLFPDIVRSSDMVAGKDPEDANDHLLPVLQTMIDAVHRFGGTVNQILGDGIMAVFGAPMAQEDHAARASLAAHAMQQAAGRLLARHPDPVVRNQAIRVGISSGEVVAQVMRGDLHTEYRIVGEAVYRAARLEKAAPAGAVLLCADTLSLAGDAVDAHSTGDVDFSEDEAGIAAFRLLGVGRRRSHVEARQLIDVPGFVGRDDDLEFLQGLLTNVTGGFGETVVLSGDAGVGKTRVINEFLGQIDERSYCVINCNLHPLGVGRSSNALDRLARQALAGTVADMRSVVARLRELGIEDSMSVHAVLELLGLSRGDALWQEAAPAERLRVTLDAVSRLVLAMAKDRPVVLVLEDFHWSDSRTRALAQELSARSGSAALMLIVTSRTWQKAPWSSWSRVVERHLSPLAPDATALLVEQLLGTSRELRRLKDRLVELTQGVPLFVIECVRSLRQSATLTGPIGACSLTIPVAEIQIPASVHALLASRIDRLPAGDRYILLCAGVIGIRFDVSLLQDLTGRQSHDLLVHLNRLETAGFIQRTRVVPNLEFSFQHALVQDVAYQTLLKSMRRDLHDRLLGALEQRRDSDLAGRIELLATHAHRAQNWPKAFVYGRRAGREMIAASRNVEAVETFERSLTCLDQFQDTRRNQERRVDLYLDLIQGLFPLADHDRVDFYLDAGTQIAERISDERRMAHLESYRSLYFWGVGKMVQAISTGRSALKHARHLRDRDLEIHVSSRLGAALIDRGDFESACKMLRTAIELIPTDAHHRRYGLLNVASVSNRAALARSLSEIGAFREAVQVGDEAVQIADEVGHPFSQVYANLWMGNTLIKSADYARAIPPLERCVHMTESPGLNLLRPRSMSSLGYAYFSSGQQEKGLALLQQAVDEAERDSIVWNIAQQYAWLAEALMQTGDLEAAFKVATKALEVSVNSGEKASEAGAL